jgi:MFS family permease
MGGLVADRWRRRTPAGRIWLALLAVLVQAFAVWIALMQADYGAFVAVFAIFCIASGAWTGVAAAIGFDILPTAHRGTGVAVYFLVTTLFGTGLGAWFVGLISEVFGSIRLALALSCTIVILAAVAFVNLALTINRQNLQV